MRRIVTLGVLGVHDPETEVAIGFDVAGVGVRHHQGARGRGAGAYHPLGDAAATIASVTGLLDAHPRHPHGYDEIALLQLLELPCPPVRAPTDPATRTAS